MYDSNLRGFFTEIQEKFQNGLPQKGNLEAIENMKMDMEVMEMTQGHIRRLIEKKQKIKEVEQKVQKRKELINKMISFMIKAEGALDKFNKQSTAKNTSFYSPFNNHKDLSSKEVLEYASRIAESIQGPRQLLEDGRTPVNFQVPYPLEDQIVNSYVYFNSRTDGKTATKCSPPKIGIANAPDLVERTDTTIRMRVTARLRITANQPSDCFIRYTVNGMAPNLFHGEQVRNQEDSLIIKEEF